MPVCQQPLLSILSDSLCSDRFKTSARHELF